MTKDNFKAKQTSSPKVDLGLYHLPSILVGDDILYNLDLAPGSNHGRNAPRPKI